MVEMQLRGAALKTESGHKQLLGLREGDTEHWEVCRGLLASLHERRLFSEEKQLFVLDGMDTYTDRASSLRVTHWTSGKNQMVRWTAALLLEAEHHPFTPWQALHPTFPESDAW